MKLKALNAALLTVCVFLMAVLAGAIPVTARADPSGETSGDSVPPIPAATPAPASYGSDESSAPRMIATTITGDSMVDNDTYYDVDPEALLEEDIPLSLPADGPQVLILHTHATEAYTPEPGESYDGAEDYRTTDPENSVLRVGEELARVLTDCGLQVIHDTTLHDYPSYNGSYARSGATAEEYLAAYPGIRVIIDLHRDALGDGERIYKTLADIDGTEAAQLMFVMGTDVNLEHPLWRENLKLALGLQEAVQARYPTLMRPVVLCDCRYNQQLTPGCLLLEVGTAGNTLEEALTGVRLFGEIAGPFLAERIGE